MVSSVWLLVYGAAAAGFAGCFFLFGRDFHALQSRWCAEREGLEEAAAQLRVAVQTLREVLEQRDGAPAAMAPSLSLTAAGRENALRMYRGGEPVSAIAAAVQAPENEIRLLLKIDRLVQAS